MPGLIPASPLFAAALLLGASISLSAHAQAIKRTVNPASTLPYASAVLVPPNAHTLYLASIIADVANPEAPKGSFEAFGNTGAQTTSILRKIDKLLAAEGFTMADVVKVGVFLVPDPTMDGKMDFAGLNTAYGQFFGSASQPNKAARTTVAVAALPNPSALVAIDIVAARMGPPLAPLAAPPK